MNHIRFLKMLEEISAAPGEQDSLVAILRAFSQVVTGNYYAAYYGSGGDVYFPDQGWLGPQTPFVKELARHAYEHPFCQDFFAQRIPRAYWRSSMVGEDEWRKTAIYQNVDSKLGVKDMIGLYYSTPDGQFGAVHCGRESLFSAADFSAATSFHRVSAILLNTRRESPRTGVPALALTPREADVLRWISEGKSNSEVAAILGISHHTVRKHLERILPKMGAENRTGAAREWVQKWADANRE